MVVVVAVEGVVAIVGSSNSRRSDRFCSKPVC